ncbi:YqaE/Pmp3 family membrane protein [Winogradskyella wichelsiae]|uniref:YqaE/Pmp3 family membrane protein n=1 Tax=Winogradskyella wichelsiae TaxID=2697007 RepID=UPI0015CD50DF|nr:YqaE/Pmp3 family membrane protein [Winogradskyella wichelsiae]
MSLLTIALSIILPPLAVFLKHGLGTEFLISIVLTIVGWLPGVIYALYVNSK